MAKRPPSRVVGRPTQAPSAVRLVVGPRGEVVELPKGFAAAIAAIVTELDCQVAVLWQSGMDYATLDDRLYQQFFRIRNRLNGDQPLCLGQLQAVEEGDRSAALSVAEFARRKRARSLQARATIPEPLW